MLQDEGHRARQHRADGRLQGPELVRVLRVHAEGFVHTLGREAAQKPEERLPGLQRQHQLPLGAADGDWKSGCF